MVLLDADVITVAYEQPQLRPHLALSHQRDGVLSAHSLSNRKIPKISAILKNQRPYSYVGLGVVENGHMGWGWLGVGVTHALCSLSIFMFHMVQPRRKAVLCTNSTAEILLLFIQSFALFV